MIPRRRFVGTGLAVGAGAAVLPLSMTSPASAEPASAPSGARPSGARSQGASARADSASAWARAYDDQRTGRAVEPWVIGAGVFAIVGSPIDHAGGEQQFVQAYARSDGKPLYRHPLTGGAAWGQDDRATYVYDPGAGIVSAYGLADGSRTWQVAVGYAPTEYAGGGGRVVGVSRDPASGTGTLVCHAGDDGREVWRTAVGSASFARPMLTADAVFLAYAGGGAERLNAATGERVWKAGAVQRSAPAIPTLVEHSGRLYHVERGTTRVLDAGSGDLLDTLALDAPPVFDSARGYFLHDGAVTAKRPDGSVVWEYRPVLDVTSLSGASNGRIAVAARDRTVTLLDSATGGVLWTLGAPDEDATPAIALGEGVAVVSWGGQALEAYPATLPASKAAARAARAGG